MQKTDDLEVQDQDHITFNYMCLNLNWSAHLHLYLVVYFFSIFILLLKKMTRFFVTEINSNKTLFLMILDLKIKLPECYFV